MKNSLKHYGYYDVLTVGSNEFYIMQEKWYTKQEFMGKMFGKEFVKSLTIDELIHLRGDAIATVDQINQYLEGNVTRPGLIESLEQLILNLRFGKA